MGGGGRSGNFGGRAGAVACAAVLLAGLATASHWHPSAQPSATAGHNTGPAPEVPTLLAPLPRIAPAVLRSSKRPRSPKPATPVLRAATTPSPVEPLLSRERAMQAYAALPMTFEANDGQSDPRVKFLARGSGYTLFLTQQEAVLALPDDPVTAPATRPTEASPRNRALPPKAMEAPRPVRSVRLRFVGAGTPSAIAGRDQLAGKTNYFIGNDPKEWHTNVPNYAAVEYRGLYSGVDAVFHGDNRQLEFDYNIAAGADPRTIALEVEGAQVRLNRAGDVLLGIDAHRDVVMGKPHIYQESKQGRSEVEGHYVLTARNQITFALGAYDHAQPLVIDPTVTYSTYLGGSVEDLPFAVAADSSGSAYIVGESYSANYPTTSTSYEPSCLKTGSMTTCPPGTAFVTKLSPDGSSLVYSTFINDHTNQDYATGVAVDSLGSAYVLGAERGEADFPTTAGAYQPTCNGGGSLGIQIFVAKLDPTGSTLDYSTCLMNSTPSQENRDSIGSSTPGGIAVDSYGDAYVTGSTDLAQDFPTTSGTLEPTCVVYQLEGCLVENDPFVVELNPTGTGVFYSTFLSVGAASTSVTTSGIAVDSLGNAYVIGDDDDSGFPAGSGLITTPNSFLPTCPTDACGGFIAELNANGTALWYSTYLAGVSDYLNPTGIAIDQSGEAFVTGYTDSSDLATTPGVLQGSFTPPGASMANGEDGFVIKMAALGGSYVYATYLSGMSYDTEGGGIGVNAAGDAFVTGIADQGFPTTPGAFQTTDPAGPNQAFFLELDPTGASLLYSTYLAGTTGDSFEIAAGSSQGVSYLATDPLGNAYVIGQTEAPNFQTTSGAYQTHTPVASGGGATGFVVKFTVHQLTILPGTLPSGSPNTAYSPVQLSATGGTGTITFAVTVGSLPNGMTLSSTGVLSGTPTQGGAFSITVEASDTSGDVGSQAYSLQIGTPQTINFTAPPPSVVYGAGSIPLSATASSGLPVSFSLAAGSVGGTLSGINNSLVSFIGAGLVRILASQAGNGTYAPASIVERDILVLPAILTVTAPPATRPYEGPDPAFTFTVTGLVGGDTLGNVLTGTPTFTAVSDLGITPAGTVLPVEVNVGTLTLTSSNYAISVVPTTLTVVCCQPQVIVTTSVPPAGLPLPIGIPLSLTGSASSGLPVTFTVVSGPGSLGTSPLGGTTLTATGSAPITVQINQPGNGNTGASIPVTVIINSPITITSPSTLPAGVVGRPYATTPIIASGGTRPYTWTATGMPPGVTINGSTDIVTGMPTSAAGSPYSALITVTDNTGTHTSQGFSIPIALSPLTINTSTLPAAVVGTTYAPFMVNASGGTGVYTFSATGLPLGLNINTSGVISSVAGGPLASAAAGSPYTVTVTVIDSANETVSRTITLPVISNGPLTITTTSPYLTTGIAGVPYTIPINAIGGTPPYTWRATGLQNGLSINVSTGVISAGAGLVPPAGTFSTLVTVEDSTAATASATYSMTVVAAPLAITPTGLPPSEVGVSYTTVPFTASGGLAPYNWTITGLPAGLGPAGAAISGTPTSATGSPFNIGVTVTDSARESASTYFPLAVYPALAITAPVSLPAGSVNATYPTNTITASGGVGPYAWSATGLPPGLSLGNSTTITPTNSIVGVPAADTGSPYSATITITDVIGGTVSRTYSITVLP